jgi:hypothetical protein
MASPSTHAITAGSPAMAALLQLDNQRLRPRRSATHSMSSSAASGAGMPGDRAREVFCKHVVTISASLGENGPCGLSKQGSEP